MDNPRRPKCSWCHKGIYTWVEEVEREIARRERAGSKKLGWYKCPRSDMILHITSKL